MAEFPTPDFSIDLSGQAVQGTVIVLVNNTGLPQAQLATKMNDELFDQVMDTNLAVYPLRSGIKASGPLVQEYQDAGSV